MESDYKNLKIPFLSLSIIQFFVTLANASSRMLAIFFLNDLLGYSNIPKILFLTSLSIIFPLFTFSMLGGELADRFNKSSLLKYIQPVSVFGAFLLYLSFSFQWEMGVYGGLFFLALHAALFGPIRLSIVPEIVNVEKIPVANSILTTINYTSLLLGAFFASYFTIVTGRDLVLVALYLFMSLAVGSIAVLGIDSVRSDPNRKISWNFIQQTFIYIKESKKIVFLFMVIIFSSYFLLACLFTQLNIIPFGHENLNLSDAESGYLLLYSSIGLGVGSMFYGIVSCKNIEVSFALVGGLGTAICYLLMVFLSSSLIGVSWLSFFIGFFGGFFIVPLNGYLQTKSPVAIRGSIIAASNMVGYLFLLLGAIFLKVSFDVLDLTALQNFWVIFGVTFGMWAIFAFELRYFILRPFLLLVIGSFLKIDAPNIKKGIHFSEKLDMISRIVFMRCFEPVLFVQKKENPSFFKKIFSSFFSIVLLEKNATANANMIIEQTLSIDGLVLYEQQNLPTLKVVKKGWNHFQILEM